MVNIPMYYSNPTIVNMYWHYRKLVYKIIVNGGGYRITYFVAGYWIASPYRDYSIANYRIAYSVAGPRCRTRPIRANRRKGASIYRIGSNCPPHCMSRFNAGSMITAWFGIWRAAVCMHARNIVEWVVTRIHELPYREHTSELAYACTVQ